jgi:hypothetical protein
LYPVAIAALPPVVAVAVVAGCDVSAPSVVGLVATGAAFAP